MFAGAADDEAHLMEKDILNLILDGMRASCSETESDIFVARAFLGKTEKEIFALYSMKPDTATGHYRRACIKILKFIHEHPEYGDLKLKGLRLMIKQRITVEERDLELLADEGHKNALRLAAAGPLSLRALGAGLSMTPEAAVVTLRAAIVALAKAKLKRVKESLQLAVGQNAEAWLWEAVGEMLAVYPEPPVQVRGAAPPSAADVELADLCQVAVYLGFDRAGVAPPRTLAEVAAARVKKDGMDATAKSLDLQRDEFLDILSGGVKPEELKPALIAKMAGHFGCDEPTLTAALRASVSPQPGGRTRGLTSEERGRLLDGVRRRVLGESKPA